MAEDLGCCELTRLVYDCPGPCRRRVYEEPREVYATTRTCEECHEDTPHRPETFPSRMELVGMHCPEHGRTRSPHLAAWQAPLFG